MLRILHESLQFTRVLEVLKVTDALMGESQIIRVSPLVTKLTADQ